MNSSSLVQEARAICREEGVTITWSAAAVRICLPRPMSAQHQLRVIWALWHAWLSMRDTVIADNRACIVDVSALGQLPLCVAGVLAVLDSELQHAGNQLILAQADAPWKGPLTFVTGGQKEII